MLVGGWVHPESEITTIPLKDDLSSLTSIQDLEWKERVKRVPLPRVPTIDDRHQAGDDMRVRNRRDLVPPTDRNAPRGQKPMMPEPPTQAGDLAGQRPGLNTQPGAGYAPSQPGGSYQPTAPSDDPYANMTAPGRKPVSGYGTRSIPTPPIMPRVGNSTANNTMIQNPYGLPNPSNPMSNPAASSGSKPYSDYRAPTGYSPWMELNQRTNNGTINPYSQYVRPQMDQLNYNARTSEQINGVQTLQRGYGAVTPGMEAPVGGGAGMANPNTFQNYKGYYPTNQ